MIGDQTSVIEFLANPATHGGAEVERIETHISIVFLAGARAWKLKRAVRFDYIDASTAERRRAFCEAEVRLNRRTAPAIYVGVVAVTREEDSSLALGGAGTPVDWLVEMRRFDQSLLFDRLAEAGRLELGAMAPLATTIAGFHKEAEERRDHGGSAGMKWVVDGNAASFKYFCPHVLDSSDVQHACDGASAALASNSPLLDRRRSSGFVRHCHGDLHLRNIVMHDGEPTIFDGVEFNDEIACVDVLYDLAFLLMDLWHRRLPGHANAVWNRYLAETSDLEGIQLMPFFLSCRAAIRAKTSATAFQMQKDRSPANELRVAARDYLRMAGALLRRTPPCLVAVGGLSGSGKSALARALAPAVGAVPGAVVIRSDEIRKELAGVPALERLGPKAYEPGFGARVYSAVAERAARIVRGGYSAIADATFLDPAQRQQIDETARAAGIPFIGLWLEAPEPILIDRLMHRTHDASDADAAVLRGQQARDAGPISWQRLDSSAANDVLLRGALSQIEKGLNL